MVSLELPFGWAHQHPLTGYVEHVLERHHSSSERGLIVAGEQRQFAELRDVCVDQLLLLLVSCFDPLALI